MNKCHDRTGNPYYLIPSKVIIGFKLCQQNQGYRCSEDLLESYGLPKIPESLKIWQVLEKSQFSSGTMSKKLYFKCEWFCSQKRQIEYLSSVICNFIGCWKYNKLQKVRDSGLKNHFWSPISSEQCFEMHIFYIKLKIWAEMVPEILKLKNLKIP